MSGEAGLRYEGFTVGELQHLVLGIYLAKQGGLNYSPIIDRMSDELDEALQAAIDREEALEVRPEGADD